MCVRPCEALAIGFPFQSMLTLCARCLRLMSSAGACACVCMYTDDPLHGHAQITN